MTNPTDGRTQTSLKTRLALALLAGSVLMSCAAHAQTAAPPDSAVLAMLTRAQPGSLYTMPGSVGDVCGRLAQAGLVAQGVGVGARDQLAHVYYDAAHRQYLSVLEGEHTVVRVTSQLPAAKVWIWAE